VHSLPWRRYRTNLFLILACPAARMERTRVCLLLTRRGGSVPHASNRLIAVIPPSLRPSRAGEGGREVGRGEGDRAAEDAWWGGGSGERAKEERNATQAGLARRTWTTRSPPRPSLAKLMHVSGIMQRLISLSLSLSLSLSRERCFFATARPMERIG